jgi:hypothetical protein
MELIYIGATITIILILTGIYRLNNLANFFANNLIKIFSNLLGGK